MTSSRQGTLKEESSDESTIISSQTSTLTRNLGAEAMLGQGTKGDGFLQLELQEDDSDDDFQINENADSFLFPVQPSQNVDKETNTECVFIQPPLIGRKGDLRLVAPASTSSTTTTSSSSSTVVKRSKTFSPSAPISKSQYNCRLNRSDSDSAMPLYRRLPFQRSSKERRSLHVPVSSATVPTHNSSNSSQHSSNSTNLTSLDLELDLAAQQSRLQVLRDEICRLRRLKSRLEEARELPAWLQEDTAFQQLLSSVELRLGEKSPEERRMERLLRRTAREIYKLRKTRTNKGQLDVQSFREKMAFFTCVKASVPILSEDEPEEDDLLLLSSSSSLETSGALHNSNSSCTSSQQSTPQPHHHHQLLLRSGTSTETVDTLTEEADLGVASSQTSTPTPHRFSYEVDPELGAFV